MSEFSGRKAAVLVGAMILCLFVAIADFGLIDWSSFVSTLVGIAVGAVITYFVSRHFARQGSEELRQEAGRLRRVANLTALGLKDAGLVDAEFNEHGDVRSVGIESHYKLTLKSDGDIEITPEERSPVFKVRRADEKEGEARE